MPDYGYFMKLRNIGKIIVGIFLIFFGIDSILNIYEPARGYYWSKLIHTILGDFFANALEGLMLISVGLYLIYISFGFLFVQNKKNG